MFSELQTASSIRDVSTTLRGEYVATKPSLDEVLKYAEPLIMECIGEKAADLPREQKEEIQQSARLRIFRSYAKLDPDAGWKSFVYTHARGAVKDYLKRGSGFKESGRNIRKLEKVGSKNSGKMRERVFLHVTDGDELEIDQILGNNGIFSQLETGRKIRWGLVARMASVDECVHVMALHCRGVGIEEMAPRFRLSRSRVGQLIQAFVDRFDDPEWANSTWLLQICYAFNICEEFGLPDIDQSTIPGNGRCGRDLAPVDLDMKEDVKVSQQMNLFDEE